MMKSIRRHHSLTRLILLFGLMSVTTAVPSSAETAKPPVGVFLLAGQSNLAGRAPGDEAGEPGGEARIRLDHVCSFSARAAGDGPPEPHRSKGWVALGPAPKHASTPGPHFGPEIGLGRALVQRDPNREWVFIKNGRGGSSLAVDWTAPGGAFYRDFIAQVRAALRRLDADGQAHRLAALVWCQGEADTTRREWAKDYARNLRALIDVLRGEFGRPDLPVIIMLTGDGRLNPQMIAPEVVRQAQRDMAAQDERVRLVEADDLGLMDQVHYDAAAQLEIGRRVAAAWFELAEETTR